MRTVPTLDAHSPVLAGPARHARLRQCADEFVMAWAERVHGSDSPELERLPVLTGLLTARIVAPKADMDHLGISGVRAVGDGRMPDGREWLAVQRPNAFVNLGLHFLLDRLFNLNTPNTAISHMGVSDDNTAVVAGTLLLDPTPAGDSPDIRAFGTGTGATTSTRTANTVSVSAGWAETDFAVVFSIRKVGALNAATDAGDDTVPTVQGVMNIIGGAGVAPYNEAFTIDLVSVTEFDLTLGIDFTPTAT